MVQQPEFGWGYFETLAKNGAIAGKGNGAVIEAVARGEKAYGIIIEYMAFNAKAKGSPVDFVFPQEGVSRDHPAGRGPQDASRNAKPPRPSSTGSSRRRRSASRWPGLLPDLSPGSRRRRATRRYRRCKIMSADFKAMLAERRGEQAEVHGAVRWLTPAAVRARSSTFSSCIFSGEIRRWSPPSRSTSRSSRVWPLLRLFVEALSAGRGRRAARRAARAMAQPGHPARARQHARSEHAGDARCRSSIGTAVAFLLVAHRPARQGGADVRRAAAAAGAVADHRARLDRVDRARRARSSRRSVLRRRRARPIRSIPSGASCW